MNRIEIYVANELHSGDRLCFLSKNALLEWAKMNDFQLVTENDEKTVYEKLRFKFYDIIVWQPLRPKNPEGPRYEITFSKQTLRG